jgi:hypothetical protein
MKYIKRIEIAPGVTVVAGEAIMYFLNGWRSGTVVKKWGKRLSITPVSAYGKTHHRNIWVPLVDVRKVEINPKQVTGGNT